MKRRCSVPAALVVAFLALCFAPSARSQVVVYSVDFNRQDGFNLDFFEAGYFVAPALGGTGTFILTSHEDGRKVLTSSAGTGNFFHGMDEDEKRITVVSATGGDGTTSSASYLAFGEVTGTVEIVTPLATYKIKVARKLKGQAIAAGDESGTTTTPDTSTTTDTTTGTTTTTDTTTSTTTTTTSSTDGTVGFAHISSMTMNFDEDHTMTANKKEQTVEETSAALVTELKQKGYVDPTETTTTTTDTTSTGLTTTTTVLVPEIAVEQPLGTGLTDGTSSIAFGTVIVGTSGAATTFTIKNSGTADLTGLGITKDGTNSGDFAVSTTGSTTVTAGSSTTFTVTFTPGALGARTAAIHIANNDSDESSFDISLTGSGG